jgi:hypothetical protein
MIGRYGYVLHAIELVSHIVTTTQVNWNIIDELKRIFSRNMQDMFDKGLATAGNDLMNKLIHE